MSNTDGERAESSAGVTQGYHCDIHDMDFEQRNWCPQCEIEFELGEDND